MTERKRLPPTLGLPSTTVSIPQWTKTAVVRTYAHLHKEIFMSQTKRSSHGNTPAAWTAVTICFLGFVVGGIAVIFGSEIGIFAGIGIFILGGVVGKVMQMAGLGQIRRS